MPTWNNCHFGGKSGTDSDSGGRSAPLRSPEGREWRCGAVSDESGPACVAAVGEDFEDVGGGYPLEVALDGDDEDAAHLDRCRADHQPAGAVAVAARTHGAARHHDEAVESVVALAQGVDWWFGAGRAEHGEEPAQQQADAVGAAPFDAAGQPSEARGGGQDGVGVGVDGVDEAGGGKGGIFGRERQQPARHGLEMGVIGGRGSAAGAVEEDGVAAEGAGGCEHVGQVGREQLWRVGGGGYGQVAVEDGIGVDQYLEAA